MNKLKNIYPWHQSVWQRLTAANQRLPHALLLHGQQGTGKLEFARTLSQALLCLQPNSNGLACGTCSSCHWFHEQSHPDFILLCPEQEEADEEQPAKKIKKKTQITIAQVRGLADFLKLSSHRSNGVRIVLIHPAEALNQAAANALLKALEEPAEQVVFLLVSHQAHQLLPTIMSRCQKVPMPMPSTAQALAWLATQGVDDAEIKLRYLSGSPIKVVSESAQLGLAQQAWAQLSLGDKMEPYALAGLLLKNPVENAIEILQKWLYDLSAVCLGVQIRYHESLKPSLQKLAPKVNGSRLLQLQKELNELRKLATHPLNHEMQLESVLFAYQGLFKVN